MTEEAAGSTDHLAPAERADQLTRVQQVEQAQQAAKAAEPEEPRSRHRRRRRRRAYQERRLRDPRLRVAAGVCALAGTGLTVWAVFAGQPAGAALGGALLAGGAYMWVSD